MSNKIEKILISKFNVCSMLCLLLESILLNLWFFFGGISKNPKDIKSWIPSIYYNRFEFQKELYLWISFRLELLVTKFRLINSKNFVLNFNLKSILYWKWFINKKNKFLIINWKVVTLILSVLKHTDSMILYSFLFKCRKWKLNNIKRA